MSTLAVIQRKLDRWELDHLRDLAAAQADQIERLLSEVANLNRQLNHAEDCAAQWHDMCLDSINHNGQTLGVTVGGDMLILAATKEVAA
jgi:hypothetical protein